MMCDGIMQFVLYCRKKFFRDRTVYIIVSTTLRINICNLLIKSAFARTNITNTLQLLLKIVFAKKIFRLSQSCIIHHVTLDDKLF